MITDLSQVTEFPLCWPENKPRAAERMDRSYRGAYFGTNVNKMTRAKALAAIEDEMRKWRIDRWIISTAPAYRQGPTDPAAALWWDHPGLGLRVLACDQYARVHDNLYAIALTLDALRGLERWGAYTMEQAIEGAKLALPPPAGSANIVWRQVLGDVPKGIEKVDALAVINARYRRMAQEAGDDEGEKLRLNLAVEAARLEFA